MEWIKQKMEKARQQRDLLHGQNPPSTGQPGASIPDSQASPRKKPLNTIWLLGAAAAWIVTIIAAWWSGSSVTTHDASLNGIDNVGAGRISEVAELKTRIATSMELEERLDHMDGRIQLLTDSVANAEARLVRVLVLTDSMPATASGFSSVALQQPSATGDESVSGVIEAAATGTSDTLAIANVGAGQPTSKSAGVPDAVEMGIPGSGKQEPVNAAAMSPWVVNLASLPDKADAERFAAEVRSKDIQVEEQAVIIKGKEYWRVQASGFSTVNEARSQANKIKEKLGLKDVWVTKR